MNAKALKETLQALIVQKLPAFVWGETGIGKSSIIRDIAKDLGLELIDLRLTLLNPAELKGLPFLKENDLDGSLPGYLPSDDIKAGILFLDDLHAASPLVQAAAYQLILDRKMGTYKLPSNWAIIAAGTLETHKGERDDIPTALANRFVHFEMDLSNDDWRCWAYANNIDHTIISFIGAHPELLFTLDPIQNQNSFATPRSWAFVNTILKSKNQVPGLLESISGAVGSENAQKFLAFKEGVTELPDYHVVFEGRSSLYPQDSSTLHLLTSTLVAQALRNPEKITLNNMLRYTLKLQPEFAILIIRDLEAQGIRFDRLEAWRDWTTTFNTILD